VSNDVDFTMQAARDERLAREAERVEKAKADLAEREKERLAEEERRRVEEQKRRAKQLEQEMLENALIERLQAGTSMDELEEDFKKVVVKRSASASAEDLRMEQDIKRCKVKVKEEDE
jgi:hypothetical protein